MAWHDTTRHALTRHKITRPSHDMTRYDMTRHNVTSRDLTSSDSEYMTSHGTVWHWYGTVSPHASHVTLHHTASHHTITAWHQYDITWHHIMWHGIAPHQSVHSPLQVQYTTSRAQTISHHRRTKQSTRYHLYSSPMRFLNVVQYRFSSQCHLHRLWYFLQVLISDARVCACVCVFF